MTSSQPHLRTIPRRVAQGSVLYRFTPQGGEPEHFTHDMRSAGTIISVLYVDELFALEVGGTLALLNGTWERIA